MINVSNGTNNIRFNVLTGACKCLTGDGWRVNSAAGCKHASKIDKNNAKPYGYHSHVHNNISLVRVTCHSSGGRHVSCHLEKCEKNWKKVWFLPKSATLAQSTKYWILQFC